MDDEIVMLALSSIGSIFCLSHRKAIAASEAQYLELALYIFTIACISTVAEGFLFPVFLNFLEHFTYLASMICIALWLYRTIRSKHTYLS